MSSIVRLRDKHPGLLRSRWSIKRLFHGIRQAWREFVVSLTLHFPPDAPEPSPPLAKAAALREGALLSEDVDARAKRSVG